MDKKRYLIAIDPDLRKSGVAVYDRQEKCFLLHKSISNVDIPDVLLEICPPEDSMSYVEDGSKIKKANLRGGNYRVAQAKARNVGQNHAAGDFVAELLIKYKYRVIRFKPLKKYILKSISGRWSPAGKLFINQILGKKVSINDDTRDAIFACDYFK